MEYYSAVKKNKLLIEATLMNLKYMLSERSLLPKKKKNGGLILLFHLHELQIQAKLYGDVR